jgi:hypothetical protein
MFQKNPQMETLFDEIRVFASRIGNLRSVLLHLGLLAALGIWVSRLKGLDFLDPAVLGAYACLGLLFAGPAVAQSFPEGIPSFKQATARVLVGVLYGEMVALALLAAGIATVYLSYRGRFVPTPDWESLATSATFGLGACAMFAALAALLAVRFSRRMAIIWLRLAFFGLLILLYYQGQKLLEVGLTGAGACLVAGGIFLELLRRELLKETPR